MVQVFRDLCREEQRREDTVGLVRLWLRTVLDLVITALLERRSSGRASDWEAVVKDYKLAGIGFVLLLAPLFFVSASLLKYGAGIGLLFLPLEVFLSVSQRRGVFNLVSPFVFLGGLALALAPNAYAVLRLRPRQGRRHDREHCKIEDKVPQHRGGRYEFLAAGYVGGIRSSRKLLAHR